jgi:hypothetical protein
MDMESSQTVQICTAVRGSYKQSTSTTAMSCVIPMSYYKPSHTAHLQRTVQANSKSAAIILGMDMESKLFSAW